MSKNLIKAPQIFGDIEYYMLPSLSNAMLLMELHKKKKPLDDSRQINTAHQKELGEKSQFNYYFTAFAAKQNTN